jgi:hypothetical protein
MTSIRKSPELLIAPCATDIILLIYIIHFIMHLTELFWQYDLVFFDGV